MAAEDNTAYKELLMAVYISKRIRETRKETIDKAVAWLESQGSKYNNEVVMISIDDFKKAMEEYL